MDFLSNFNSDTSRDCACFALITTLAAIVIHFAHVYKTSTEFLMEKQNPTEMERQLHPLQNSALAPMRFQDFKNVRQVCRCWYQETMFLWRKSVVLTLHDNAEQNFGIHPNALIAEIENPDPRSILCLKETPYNNYKLTDMTIDIGNPDNSTEAAGFRIDVDPGSDAGTLSWHARLFRFFWEKITSALDFWHMKDENALAAEFWDVVGPYVRHLTLENMNVGGSGNDLSPSRLFRFFRDKMPNLEHLGLISEKFVQEFFQKGIVAEKIDLPGVTSLSLTARKDFCLTDFPNLRTLRLHGGAEFASTPELTEDQLFVVNSTVTRLELGWVYNRNKVFTVRFAALKHLQMVMDDEGNPRGGLPLEIFNRRNNFLQAHLSSLQTCNLIQWNLALTPTESPFKTDLPNLTEVRFYGNVVPDLSFIRYTPNLTNLLVDVLNLGKQRYIRNLMRYGSRLDHTTARYVERDLVEGAVATGVTLRHITSLFLSCRLSPDSVQMLGEWMPNLKEFKAVLNPVTLRITLEQWSALSSVHCLIGTRLQDTDMPNLIPLMSKLQSFRYDSVCGHSGFSNGDKFLDLSALVSLELCVSQNFPKHTEMELKKRIQHVGIYRNHPGNPQHFNWKCCRFSEYKVEFLRHILHTTWRPTHDTPAGYVGPVIPDLDERGERREFRRRINMNEWDWQYF